VDLNTSESAAAAQMNQIDAESGAQALAIGQHVVLFQFDRSSTVFINGIDKGISNTSAPLITY